MGTIGLVIADDHEYFRSVVLKYLERDEEIRILAVAENGEQTLECVRLMSPDIVLLDFSMPVLDGIGVIKTLGAERNPVKVLVFSAFSDEVYIQTVIDHGCCGYLLKSEDPATLLQVLKRIYRGETNFFSAEVAKKMQGLGYKLDNNLKIKPIPRIRLSKLS